MSAAFVGAYGRTVRPGAPPERRPEAPPPTALDSARGERQLCERIGTDLLVRRFPGLRPSDGAFEAATPARNRKRLDDHDLTAMLSGRGAGEAVTAGLWGGRLSGDGTLIGSFAAAETSRPTPPPQSEHPGGRSPRPGANGLEPRAADAGVRGRERTDGTRRGTTDPESEPYRKGLGKEAEPPRTGHAPGEDRHGPILAAAVTEANGAAERSAALGALGGPKAARGVGPTALGADEGSDDGGFPGDAGPRGVGPRVPRAEEPRDPAAAAGANHRPGVEARQRMTAGAAGGGYRLGRTCRNRIEEGSGGPKTTAGSDRTRAVGRRTLRQAFGIGAAASHLARPRALEPA